MLGASWGRRWTFRLLSSCTCRRSVLKTSAMFDNLLTVLTFYHTSSEFRESVLVLIHTCFGNIQYCLVVYHCVHWAVEGERLNSSSAWKLFWALCGFRVNFSCSKWSLPYIISHCYLMWLPVLPQRVWILMRFVRPKKRVTGAWIL